MCTILILLEWFTAWNHAIFDVWVVQLFRVIDHMHYLKVIIICGHNKQTFTVQQSYCTVSIWLLFFFVIVNGSYCNLRNLVWVTARSDLNINFRVAQQTDIRDHPGSTVLHKTNGVLLVSFSHNNHDVHDETCGYVQLDSYTHKWLSKRKGWYNLCLEGQTDIKASLLFAIYR